MTNEPYNQLTCQPLSPNKPQIAPHLPLLTPAPECRPNTPPAQLGPTNGNANPPMRRPGRLIRPRYCGERLGATITRTDRAETPPVGFGRESGRTLRAKRGCQVSRAARHEGTHNPNKQPHHHQKQRPSGGRCTRYGTMHPIRGAAPDQKRCIAYGSGAVPQHTRINAGLANRVTPGPQPARAQGTRRTSGGC